MTFYYVIALLAAYFVLVVAEFCVPSGGILGTAAAAALISAVVIAFSHSPLVGMGVVLFALVTTPLVLVGMVRAWPHTPIGRRMLNRRPGETASSLPQRTTSRGTPLDQLVGRLGVAKTHLLPSGLVLIDGEKLDAVSNGMPIDAGSTILVTSVDVGRLHVRAVGQEELVAGKPPAVQSPPALEKSLDSFEVE
jgi:membrane-bound ClpP family serine protease